MHIENRQTVKSETQRKWIALADNVRHHSAQWNIDFCAKIRPTVSPHPHYSANQTLSGYFLFGYIKDKLKCVSFPSAGTSMAQKRQSSGQSNNTDGHFLRLHRSSREIYTECRGDD
jgi:hypothetical protein